MVLAWQDLLVLRDEMAFKISPLFVAVIMKE